MRHLAASLTLVFLAASTLSGQTIPSDQSPTDAAAAGHAMSTIFSPTRAPKRKTMGLLQRSFLDLAGQGDQELEVALVIDGTDSMTTELAGVRNSIHRMMDDLRKYRNNEVRAAIVVYRDAGSPSGEVVIPINEFTSDPKVLEQAVESLQPESGAPFFHELPDLGLHHALTKLPWSQDDQVTKWILMFGDAPPYAESYQDKATPEAYRRFATPLLVSIAKQKNIRINCVLCKSNDNVGEPYDQAIDETREFMTALSSGTDGLMLDLSYEAIRTAMVDAAQTPDVQLASLQPITAIDLAAVRRNRNANAGAVRNVSLAVIPHMPLTQVTFDARHPAVQVSAAIRSKLSKVPGVRVARPREIKEQLRRLQAEGIKSGGAEENRRAIRGLAARLGVDYVVWGTLTTDQATVQTAAFRRNDGQQIGGVPISLANHTGEMAFALIEASAKAAPDDQALGQLMASMQTLQNGFTAPMATTDATNADVLTAMEALEQALASEAGSDESVELLETADQASKNAIKAESDNPIAHWLQSNVAYNQAARLYKLGDKQAAKLRMGQVRRSLGQAWRNKDKIRLKSLETEIEADYWLLVENNPSNAVEKYIELTAVDQPLQSQLRGHWMLSGIYAGDWGNVNKDVVDLEQSRRHITEILANWPNSPEATLLKEWLRWDETQEQTEFNFLPRMNLELSGA